MRFWQVSEDVETRFHRHVTPDGFGHALLTPIIAQLFQELRLGATLWDGRHWWSFHSEVNLLELEGEHRVDTERIDYNERNFARVQRQKRLLVAEREGFCDVFLPILAKKQVVAVLVTGPFATRRPTSGWLYERWLHLTGRQAHLADPQFALYLSRVLSSLVLEGKALVTFKRLLQRLARLLAGEGNAGVLMNEAEVLMAELLRARLPERVWDTVKTMVDDRFPHAWQSASHAYTLQNLGISRVADHVLVGLSVSRKQSSDALDEALRRDAFQRAAVELGRKVGDVLTGRVGEHGVVFVSAAKGGAARKRQKLIDLSERASDLARQKFGLLLHFGACVPKSSSTLSATYQAALAAAESALIQGTRLVLAETESSGPTPSLSDLRGELALEAEQHPERLPARFDRYVESVAAQSGFRHDVARGHLEAAFERITAPLLATGALEAKSVAAMSQALERTAKEAGTLTELLAAYRRTVGDIAAALQRPVEARQDRSLRRAVEHIHQHYTQPLRLDAVAKVAGFAPSHFSKLFMQHENTPFEKYLRSVRLERAKQLLADTELDAKRVAELSGFHTAQYFSHVFREVLGLTPLAFRERSRDSRSKAWNK